MGIFDKFKIEDKVVDVDLAELETESGNRLEKSAGLDQEDRGCACSDLDFIPDIHGYYGTFSCFDTAIGHTWFRPRFMFYLF